MEKILVLMSTYNGHEYIEQQIESIFKQKEVLVSLLIRDDGSNDNTIDKINSLKKKYSDLNLITGNNLGPAKSFMELIKIANNDYSCFDYYAFSDQDDVWLDNKLKKAISLIQKKAREHKYILYSSNLKVVDEKLQLLYQTENQLYSYEEYLLRNNMAGCTMVFNNQLCHLLNIYYPNYIEMHDSWILRVALSSDDGYLIQDDNSYILYRQHGNNAVGSSRSVIKNFKFKLYNLFSKKKVTTKTAKELLEGYSDYINDNKKSILSVLCNDTNIMSKYLILVYFRKIKFSSTMRRLFFIWDTIFGNL
jgi:glycosyltransferase involved in cell wall biosynthesis